jgi:hypothetical protein
VGRQEHRKPETVTVIACRNGIVAADTASWVGNILHARATKIWRLPDGAIFAAAGWKPVIHRARDWIADGAPADRRPKEADKDDLEGIVLMPNGHIWTIIYTFDFYETDNHEMSVAGAHHEFLLGAMRAGAGAAEAVALAIEYCRYADGEVMTERLG